MLLFYNIILLQIHTLNIQTLIRMHHTLTILIRQRLDLRIIIYEDILTKFTSPYLTFPHCILHKVILRILVVLYLRLELKPYILIRVHVPASHFLYVSTAPSFINILSVFKTVYCTVFVSTVQGYFFYVFLNKVYFVAHTKYVKD